MFCYEKNEGSFCYPSNYTHVIKNNLTRNKDGSCSEIHKSYFTTRDNETHLDKTDWSMSDKICLTSISWIPVVGLVIYLVSFSFGEFTIYWIKFLKNLFQIKNFFNKSIVKKINITFESSTWSLLHYSYNTPHFPRYYDKLY